MANIFVTSSVRQSFLYEKYFVTSSVRQPDLYEKSGSPSFSEVEQPTSERDDGISEHFGKTSFTAPLHGILHGLPTLRYVYGYFHDPVHRYRRHDHREHCTAA